MALSVGDLKSGSAILTEITRLIPAPLSLDNLVLKETTLRLRGKAKQPNGIEHINLFLLNLKDSSFLVKDTVRLVKVSETSEDGGGSQSGNLKALKFTVTADFSNDISKVNKKTYLNDLGSKGLARRIDILEKEGLLE